MRWLVAAIVLCLGACGGSSSKDIANQGGGAGGGSDAGTGGVGNAGSGGTGQAGAAPGGAAGSSSGGCADPNPAGCPQNACPPTDRCEMSMADCRPSECTCSGAEWVCTRDCGGGVCRPVDCPMGCWPETECGTNGTSWVCTGSFDDGVFAAAGCEALPTQVPRYCCPRTFLPECRRSL